MYLSSCFCLLRVFDLLQLFSTLYAGDSWNVYGRENRLKVSRDEAKHAEEQRIKLEKQRLVSSTFMEVLTSCSGLHIASKTHRHAK